LKGLWKDGVWDGGTWDDGTWQNGTWKDGHWWGGKWWGGIWKIGYIDIPEMRKGKGGKKGGLSKLSPKEVVTPIKESRKLKS